jgi:hypothetical protein
MKGLKKIALTAAIAAVSAGAQAELKALDDSAMGELTGQAGLTIDVETKYTIGEFQYKDAGSLFLTNISLGGNENAGGAIPNSTYLDNFRMTIDIAGSQGPVSASDLGDNTFAYGFAEVRGLAAVHVAGGNGDSSFLSAAGGTLDIATTGNLLVEVTDAGRGVADLSVAGSDAIDSVKTYGDGDLVIHFGFTDAWQKAGGFGAMLTSQGIDYAGTTSGLSLSNATFEQAIEVASKAVDFNFSIDAIGIASSDFVTGETATAAGAVTTTYNTVDVFGNAEAMEIGTNLTTGTDADASTTVLISNLDINGFLGPGDLHIENNGNGFGGNTGSGDADSKIHWGSYFKITDLDVYIDIAGLMIQGLRIDNVRGDTTGLDGTSSFGFAHSIRDIYAVKDAIFQGDQFAAWAGGTATSPLADGVALNTRFKGDMDIAHLSFGDTGTSIGELYWTDIESDTKWTISAH